MTEITRRSGSQHIATVPTGAKMVRWATPNDWQTDPKRIALFELPDGNDLWVTHQQADEKRE